MELAKPVLSPVKAVAPVVEGELEVQKIYVLDTNVLLHDPTAVYSFNEHKVILPMTVLEELDDIKDRRDKDVSKEARIAIQHIDKLLANATTREIQEGVEIVTAVEKESSVAGAGTLSIFQGLRVGSMPEFSVEDPMPNSSRLVFPMRIAPAS